MSGSRSRPRRPAPAPGEAPLPAPNAAALLRRNAADPAIADRPAVRFEDRIWTHGEYVAESCRWANLFLDRLPPDRPPHVAVLLDNIPEYLFAFGGAALAGAAVVGLNHTRRGEHLLRDIEHTHCGLVITEPKHRDLLAPIADRLPPLLEVGDEPRRRARPLRHERSRSSSRRSRPSGRSSSRAGRRTRPRRSSARSGGSWSRATAWASSWTSTPDDVGYVCMPLFHSNAVQVGWAPSRRVRRERRAGPQVLGVALAERRAPLRRDLLQLHRQAAGLPPRAARAARRRRQPAAGRLRQRGITAGRRVVRPALRGRGHRRVRRDRRGSRGRTAMRTSGPARSGRSGPACRSSTTTGHEKPRAQLRRAGPAGQRGRVRRRDRQHRGRRARSRATTTTPRRPSARRASAGTGPATSGTSTRTATSSSPVAPRTGSASTARTSRPGRSRTRSREHPDVVLGAVYGVPDERGRGPGDGRASCCATARASTPTRSRDWLDGLGRHRAEVAAALRPAPARAADHRDEQDREAHARAPEVAAAIASTVTRSTRGAAARTPTVGSPPPTSRLSQAAFTQRRPRAVLGPLMDLSFTAEERAFADEIRTWLADQPRPPTRVRLARRGDRVGPEVAGQAGRRPLDRDPLAGGVRRPGRVAGRRSRSTTWSTPARGRCSR